MSQVRYYSSIPKPIGNLLERITRPANKKRGFTEQRLLTEWAQIVGPELAAYSIPQKIAYNRHANNAAALHILVTPAWAIEIQYMEPVILERIATFFGYNAVTRLIIHQGMTPPSRLSPKIQPETAPLPDGPLFAAHEEGTLKDTLRSSDLPFHT